MGRRKKKEKNQTEQKTGTPRGKGGNFGFVNLPVACLPSEINYIKLTGMRYNELD